MTTRVILVLLVCLGGCVTQTERLPYRRYAPPPQDESILDEVRREFGWHPSPSGDRFYTRAVRGITQTLSGWFRSEEDPDAAAHATQERLRQQFEEERQQALQRLRARQAQERVQD